MARTIDYGDDGEDTKVSLNSEEELTDFGTGATRSKDADGERFDLISPNFLRRLSKIMAEGATTHGTDNWRLGIPISATYNHMFRHLNLWHTEKITGKKIDVDDHMAKVVFGAMAIIHYEENGPCDYGTLIPHEELKNHPDVVAKKSSHKGKK